MGRRVSLPTLLLLLAAASLVSVLQLPPLVSSAPLRPPVGSYSFTSPGRTQKLTKWLTVFLKNNWFGIAVNAGQYLLPLLSPVGNDTSDQPPPPPPGDNADDQPPASPPGDNADDRLPPLPTGNSDGQRQGSRPAQNAGLYYVDLFVGSPPQKILGVMDISTEFVWMQCGCTACSPSSPASAFQYSASSTFSYPFCSSNFCQMLLPRTCGNIVNEPCNYYTYYGQQFFPVGYTVTDTFTFGNTPVRSMIFGCTGDYSGPPGVIGFGRGPLSLVSQLGISSFSYLMPPQDSDRGIQIQFDEVAMAQAGRSNSTTPLQTSSLYPYSYYVSLIGIQVDGKYLGGIPAGTFDLQNDGSGGVVLSTTVPVTFLVQDAYNALKQALMSKIPVRPVHTSGRAGSLDLCYMARSMAGVNVPRLTLVFLGGAALDLSAENYFFRFNDGQSDLLCLTVLPSKGVSLLGSLMQMGTKMIYDLAGEQLTFVTENTPSHVFVAPEAPSPTSQAPNTSHAAWLATIVPAAAMWTLLF